MLHDITFSIERGEFVAIMGPSGSGKSTLLHILAFLDEPTGGVYEFEGRTFASYSPIERARIRNKKIGFVFQAFNLLKRTTVLENAKLPLAYSEVPSAEWDERAKKALTAVGLAHRLEHEPSELSGGEMQRAAIARALINEPEILLADEPTGNLDSASGKSIMEIITKLNRDEHRTVLVITHDDHIAAYADRTIRIMDGRIATDTKIR
ncbi:macrolide ABC transporter ATP-binding protein [Candidatus Uhrbacteria bacterium CG10_big_fil_rev_8_21_14_0_10_48_11]|uniref:Macrolide ABC transporter ATP-binding protein n=1 Tax=Candidatus Uhrbacteria bacterium CG10_big_fil_rev_8_21_14_0_10_48_11 TaxID=1975037 RepID=A0A2M8LEN6_9BACT|nr:MAG: macrolide ABC transporter ATP-binding protein [Candidatus Uhrbacteria bacterium CG10_big_fil_rev_8_21_14_0_10_48_11]